MTPTLFMAWLSHPSSGGYWTAEAREQGGYAEWDKLGPLHLSLHTSREGAEAALLAAAEREYDEAELSYAHGPREAHADLLDYLRRFVDYSAHITEQPCAIDGPMPEEPELSPEPPEPERLAELEAAEEDEQPEDPDADLCSNCRGSGCQLCGNSGTDPAARARRLQRAEP